MIPGKYDITIYRGSTWTIDVSKKNSAGVYVDFEADYINNPTPGVGLIRMHIRPAWKVKATTTKLDPLLSLTTANGRISVSGTVLTFTLPASVTAALTFNEGTYDVELVTGETEPVVDKLLYGTVSVQDEKTV